MGKNKSRQSVYRSVFCADLLANQTHIVTGAGSGIGRCTAHELSNLGAYVILVGRKIEKLNAVKNEIINAGGKASVYACDIRDELGIKNMVSSVVKECGSIDGLVNNAGGQFPKLLSEMSLNGWDAVVRNNLTGGFLLSREVFNQSMKLHGGSIVNIIADIWGGMPTMGHSGAARAGMLSFTETAACEWSAFGVRVNSVAPGWVASSGFDTYSLEEQAKLRSLKNKVPLQRFGTESEVSATIVFLLSEAASFITGTCIRVDGGVQNARPTWTLEEHEKSKPYNGFALSIVPECLKPKKE